MDGESLKVDVMVMDRDFRENLEDKGGKRSAARLSTQKKHFQERRGVAEDRNLEQWDRRQV